jgi:transcriptional regulator with XRE-family HTH domain
VDVHIGKRLRLRRMLIGLSQEDVASAIGVAFQQIQKYECAINRISTSRLWDLSIALHCPVSFFYEGMDDQTAAASPRHLRDDTPPIVVETARDDIAVKQETLKLVRAYYTIKRPNTRRQILELATSLGNPQDAPAAEISAA